MKNHVHNALEKLQLENRTQAAAYIVRQGLGRDGGAVSEIYPPTD